MSLAIRILFGSALVMGAVAAACGGATTNSANPDGTNPGDDSGSGTAGTPTGLPCDVATVIATKCASCHGSPPTQSAPMSLMSYDDLVAPSSSDPSQTNAQRMLVRMQQASAPMPPKPNAPATADDIAAVQNWINAGMPKGSCDLSDAGIEAGPDPFAAPPQCTSGSTYTPFPNGSSSMFPGQPCVSCHQSPNLPPFSGGEGGPSLLLGGTVYPTAHEPNNCRATGDMGGPPINTAKVVATDANGKDWSMSVNSVGNFYLPRITSTLSFKFPYTIKVLYDGRERDMTTKQTSGDCNACHTQDGTTTDPMGAKAPGRVLLP